MLIVLRLFSGKEGWQVAVPQNLETDSIPEIYVNLAPDHSEPVFIDAIMVRGNPESITIAFKYNENDEVRILFVCEK